jgi:hypothetical protein
MIKLLLIDVLLLISKISSLLLICLLLLSCWIYFIVLFQMMISFCYVLFPRNLKIYTALASLRHLKAPGPDGFIAFRSISLCNIIYKIISKLLANRLKPLLSNIISHFQIAFVPNFLIQDNSILAHEILHILKFKRGRGGLTVVNIDMEKAFDKMEWTFLLAILQKLGFHPTWINWIRLCISTTSFFVLLNGSPFGLFSHSRYLKQGDPLSHFLFIIGLDAISRLLYSSLRSFKIARTCTPLNHILFADDLVIFSSATSGEVALIKTYLDKCSS